MLNEDTTPPPIKQNDWAVASAVQHLLGRVSPNALAVGIALAAHVPFDGSRLRVWPSWKRLMDRCGIGSRMTLNRVLQELEQHGHIEVGRGGDRKDRRKSHTYLLHCVSIPQHVIDRTLQAVENASCSTETVPRRGIETVPVGVQKLYPNVFQENLSQVKAYKPPLSPPKSGGRTRHPHGFESFWTSYPKLKPSSKGKEVGKAQALKAWNEINPSPTLANTIVSALKDQIATQHFENATGDQALPFPSNWLKGERWDDETSTTTNPLVDQEGMKEARRTFFAMVRGSAHREAKAQAAF